MQILYSPLFVCTGVSMCGRMSQEHQMDHWKDPGNSCYHFFSVHTNKPNVFIDFLFSTKNYSEMTDYIAYVTLEFCRNGNHRFHNTLEDNYTGFCSRSDFHTAAVRLDYKRIVVQWKDILLIHGSSQPRDMWIIFVCAGAQGTSADPWDWNWSHPEAQSEFYEKKNILQIHSRIWF